MKIVSYFIWLTLSFAVISSYADNWNVGSGGKPSRNGQSTEVGPVAADILWQGGVSSVIAQQAVTDGNIVFTSRITNINDVLHGTLIVAQDLTTGVQLWTAEVPVDFPTTDWRSRVSAARNGLVFVTRSGNTNYSYMYALNAVDGTQVWKSEGLVNESTTESAAFASNGDLVVGNFDSVIRINVSNGTTVWETDRVCPTSNGQEVAVHGDRGYYWEASPYGPKMSVIDLQTGSYLFSSAALSPGLVQQIAPFTGPDGTIYGTRSMNNVATDFLFALKDNGTSLSVQWSTPLGYVPFGTFGVGPDGTIYSYSAAGEVIRLNPLDGSIMNTSQVIFFETVNQPRIAIDANGIVFVTNGNFTNGKLYSFNPDLSLRWSENITNVNLGGPAIGLNGTMVVCGVGTNVKAYEGNATLQAQFYADDTHACLGQEVHFYNQSSGNPITFNWHFEGGTPEFSQLENPVVVYNSASSFDVTLEVGDGMNTSTLTLTDYITVSELPLVTFNPLPFFCDYYPPYELIEGSPEGGEYSGTGVNEGYFYPSEAGAGIHTLSYTYTDENGCQSTAYADVTVDDCTGIPVHTAYSEIEVKPNPSKNYFTLDIPVELINSVLILKITDLPGSVILQDEFVNAGTSIKVSAENWKPGIYIIELVGSNKKSYRSKVIIQ